MNTPRRIALAALLALLAPGPAPAQPEPPPPVPDTRAQRDALLAELLAPVREEFSAPAVGAAMIKDGEVIALAVVGTRKHADTTPATPADLFHIGSCTKAMTATLAGVLVEQGKLRWDTTVGEALPSLADKIDRAYASVTLEMLLCHRSGLPGKSDRPGSAAVWRKIWALSGDLRAQRLAAAELILGLNAVGPPGAVFEYSNYGYMVAGAMIESAGGDSWEILIERELFAPLGITTAGFGAPGRPESGEAGPDDPPAQPWGHRRDAEDRLIPVPPGLRADNPAALGPAGTVHIALEDWLKFADLHARGGRGDEGLLLTPDTFRKLHTPHGEYALGWNVTFRPWGGTVLAHGGSNTMWNAVAWIAPEKGAAFIAVNNLPIGGRCSDRSVWTTIRTFFIGRRE